MTSMSLRLLGLLSGAGVLWRVLFMVLQCMKIDEPAITLATMCHDVDDERSGELAHARPRPIVLDNSLSNARWLHKEEDPYT